MKEQDAAHSFDLEHAIKLMRDGKNVTHRFFEQSEWITLKDRCILPEEYWQTGWSLVEEKPNEQDKDAAHSFEARLEFLREYAKCGINHNYSHSDSLKHKLQTLDDTVSELTRLRSELQQKDEEMAELVEIIRGSSEQILAHGYYNEHLPHDFDKRYPKKQS